MKTILKSILVAQFALGLGIGSGKHKHAGSHAQDTLSDVGRSQLVAMTIEGRPGV